MSEENKKEKVVVWTGEDGDPEVVFASLEVEVLTVPNWILNWRDDGLCPVSANEILEFVQTMTTFIADLDPEDPRVKEVIREAGELEGLADKVEEEGQGF